MQTTLKMKTRVLPGKRIGVTAPELIENTDVDVIVVLPEAGETVEGRPEQPEFASAWDYLQSLPPIQHTDEEWAEIEREFRQERDSWDR